MTTEKKQNENQSSPQNQEAAQTESVTLTPEEKKQELLSVLLKRETVQESADLYDDCGCFGKYGFR